MIWTETTSSGISCALHECVAEGLISAVASSRKLALELLIEKNRLGGYLGLGRAPGGRETPSCVTPDLARDTMLVLISRPRTLQEYSRNAEAQMN